MPDNTNPSTTPDERFEEVLAEILLAEEAGKPLDLSRVVRAHPGLEAPLREFFRNRDGFDRLAPHLAPVAAPPPLAPGSRFGDYEVLGELGRGGMGVVYKARERSLRRLVALKMILAGHLAGPEQVQRFRREARVVAQLDHPNIVPIYEVGEHNGQHYFSMKLIEGGSLSRDLAHYRRNHKAAAFLMARVARAVHFSHQREVLHLDLKPGNVLLDARKQPHVTDFGLAKWLGESGSLSPEGAVIGTAGYMAPEQAAGRDRRLTPAADVYGLGAILYEMLTGRPPFQGATVVETLWQVLDRAPAPPRQLNPAVPRDLETICLRCLDKRPSHRYASAEKLAEDLENWVEGKPIAARRVGRLERAWLWCRRRPALVGLTTATLLAITLGSGVAVVNLVQIRDAQQRKQRDQEEWDRREAQIDRDQEEKNALISKANADRQEQGRIWAVEKEREGEREKDRADKDRRLWDREQRLANQEGDAVVAARYEEDIRKAARLAESEDYEALSRMLRVWEPAPKAHDYRFWEWHYFRAVAARSSLVRPYQADPKSDDEWYFSLQGHGHPVARLDWGPDGRRLAVYDSEGWLRVLDVATGRELFALQVERGDPRRNWPLTLQARRRTDAWGPAGDRLALADADGAVKILDAATGKQVAELPRPRGGAPRPAPRSRGRAPLQAPDPNGYRPIAWAPDGRRIAAGGGDGKVSVYDATTGKEVYSLAGHEGPVLAVAWSSNGRQLASGGTDGKVKVWDMRAGREEYTLTEDAAVVALAWRPDGRQLITSRAPANSRSGAIRPGQGSTLWDTVKREVVWSAPATASRSSEFTWSSDGRRLGLRLVGADDAYREQQLLDVVSGSILYRTGRALAGRVFADRELRRAVQLTATGIHLRGFVLDLPDGPVSRVLVPWLSTSASNLPKYEGIEQVAWSPEGTTVALASTLGNLQVRHLPRAGQRSRTLVVPDARGAAWEPDNLHFAINGLTGSLPLGVGDQRKVYRRRPPSILQGILALSRKGTRLAATLDDKSIQLWDVTTGKRTLRLAGHQRFADPPYDGLTSAISALWWGPNGKYLASYRAWDGTFKVWDVASGAELFSRDLGANSGLALAWSPDETRLALSVSTSSNERDTSVLDAVTGRRLRRVTSEAFSMIAWSPDGKLLACGQEWRSAFEIWDAEAATKVDALDGKTVQGGFGPWLAWGPAGRRVAWATSHNGGGIYDVKTRQVVRFQTDAGTAWKQLVWKPDGKQLAVTNTGNVLVFDAATGARVSTARGQSLAWTQGRLLAASLETKQKIVETAGPMGSVSRRTVQEAVLQVNNRTTGKTLVLEPLPVAPPPAAPAPPARPAIRGAGGWRLGASGWRFSSPDHKRSAGLRSPRPGDFNTPTVITLYDAAGKVERELVGEPAQINVGLKPLVAWSPDGKHIAGGGNNVRVWNAATGAEAFRLTGHDGVVESVAWSPDGRRIITRSEIRKSFRNSWELKVWDAGDGHEIFTLRGLVAELTFNPALTACSFVLTNAVGNDPAVVLWDLSPARGKGDK
jgi:WD40 repeat protein